MARILVIDDSNMARKMIRSAMEGTPHILEDWDPPQPEDLFARLKDAKPDLLVLDYNMPCYTGLQIFRMVRNYWPRMPVILFTANQDPEVLAQFWHEGVNSILPKPAGLKIFPQVVEKVLEAPAG